MDSLELLQILDVIRNEKLYNERLDVLRKAEEAFKEQKLVAKTLEIAQKKLDEAKQILEQASLEGKIVIEKAQLEANNRLIVATEKEAMVAQKEIEFGKRKQEIEQMYKDTRMLKNEIATQEMVLRSRYEKLAEEQSEVRKIKEEYFAKMQSLRNVMGL